MNDGYNYSLLYNPQLVTRCQEGVTKVHYVVNLRLRPSALSSSASSPNFDVINLFPNQTESLKSIPLLLIS
jgi:hypothetical protein